MNCTCKTDIEAKLLERLKGETPTGSDHAVSLSNYGFVLVENRMTIRPYTVANTSVTMPKKGGGFTQKRNTMNMFFSVCPYCGLPVDGSVAKNNTQPVGLRWIAFDEQEPPETAAKHDASVKTTDRVLVTNNLNARDAMWRNSHVWFVRPIKTAGGSWVAFDEGEREIIGLTHWCHPLRAIEGGAA